MSSRKIKVMQITANLGIGGLERIVVNLCRNLNKKFFEVSACCLKFKGEFAKELENNGIPVYLLPGIPENRADYAAFWRLKDIFKKVRPDIIHTHNSNSFIDSALASLFSPVHACINTDHARNFPGRFSDRIMEALCAPIADKFVAVSEETKQGLIRYEKIPANKIQVVRNGIDGKAYDIKINIQEKKAELGLNGYENIVGLGARLSPEKGIQHLIEAGPIILRAFPNTGFVVAGKGKQLATLESLAKKHNVSECFHFIGPRLDFAEVLQVIDIYIIPSEREGLPLALLEAMAAGRPIVAAKVGDISAGIKDGESGLLVEPKNPKALAEAICALLGNEEQRRLLGKNARNRFYLHFSIDRMIRDYELIYSEVLKKKQLDRFL